MNADPIRRLVSFVIAAGRRFYADKCLVWASALAYSSLLSLVPLLAVMFAVLKGMGVQHRLEPLLLSRLSLSAETTSAIIGYIDRTNVKTLGALGAATLLLSVISVLNSIESSFNHIWRVRRSRTLWRRVTDYLGVVLLAPFLLLATIALTSTMHVQQLLEWLARGRYLGSAVVYGLRLAPVLVNAAAIGLVYAVMPNRRPHVPAVMFSALGAGAAWQAVQVAYVSLQIGVARYNAIYGALAQLPVTLVWLYISWVVVLAGAELAATYELGADGAASPGAAVNRAAVALHVLVRAAHAFVGAGGAIRPAVLARELRVDGGELADIIEMLMRCGWLAPLEDDPPRYVLALDPAGIGLAPLQDLSTTGVVPHACDPRVTPLLHAVSGAGRRVWSEWTLADVLAGRRLSAEAPEPAASNAP